MSDEKEHGPAKTEVGYKKLKIVEHDGPLIRTKKSNLEENSVELNLDCLLDIFEYVPLLDRVRVSRVNKKWYEASCLSLSRLKSWEIRCIDSTIVFNEFKTNLRIEVHCKSKVFEEFLLRFGKFVLNLDASDVSEEMHHLLIILSTCRNIKKADFSQMCIEKVRFLLWNLEKLTDLTFYEIDDIYENGRLEHILSRLRLRSFHITSADDGGEFLKSLSPNIECLNIEHCELYNVDSTFNILVNFKNLRSLSLAGTLPNYINVEVFIDFLKKLNIEKLNISWNAKAVDDNFIIELAKYADKFIGLDISNNNVTDRGLNAVTNLPNLEVLVIEDLVPIKGNVDVNLPNLKCLRCRYSNFSEKALIKFLKTSDKIEYLELDKISEEFILAAGKVVQARKSKIPIKILIDMNYEKILKIVNKVPKEHTRLLKFIKRNENQSLGYYI